MDKPTSVEYSQMLSQWIDEAWPKIDAFKKQFPSDMEGIFKYLTTVHLMMAEFCERFNIPPEQYSNFVTSALGAWYTKGKPDSFAAIAIPEDQGKPN